MKEPKNVLSRAVNTKIRSNERNKSRKGDPVPCQRNHSFMALAFYSFTVYEARMTESVAENSFERLINK